MIRAVTALLYLAERKIEVAIERGEFDDLPGAGQPLDLDDIDPMLPEELRMAWRILKNAAMGAADTPDETAERARARKKLLILEKRIEARYYELALAKLGR
jgi:Domain of unknown function (DUF1992)